MEERRGGRVRTIIAGSRELKGGYLLLSEAIKKIDWEITCVISGSARGMDMLGERWAVKHNIRLEKFPADWKMFGKRAGILRNCKMAENADALLAVWNGKSNGTEHMIRIAKAMKLKVYVHTEEKANVDLG